jgi:Zn-dependent peptidase ImmA (M78 family)/transcriptional regulator with XRE-family HTH domain
MTTYLRLAREARGLTQTQVANALRIAAPDLSRWERGLRPVPEHWRDQLADHYGVLPDLLTSSVAVDGPVAGPVHHRQYKNVPAAVQKQIDARVMLHARAAGALLDGVELDVPFQVPELDVSPRQAAMLVRANWRLPSGPIPDLVGALERAGVIVLAEPFGTDRIAGLSVVRGTAFVMVVNTDCPWDRIRFTLAHELGHLVMHRSVLDEHVETEANDFASHFLMPDEDIAPDLVGRKLTWGYLLSLKPYWGCSAGATLQKAKALGAISERQYVSIRKYVSRTGQHRVEPNPLPPEQPTLLREIVEVQRGDLGSWQGVASHAGTWQAQEIARGYGGLRLASA